MLDLVKDRLLLVKQLERHREQIHERKARSEPKYFFAEVHYNHEDSVALVHHFVKSVVLVVLDQLTKGRV